MPKVVGIDLGTTNSLVAYMDGSVPRIIVDAEGRGILPSVIAFGEKGEIVVGEEAKRQLISHSERTIYSIKRFMGKGLEDVHDDLSLIPFHLANGQKEVIRIQIGGKLYTPPEISAFIL